MRFSIGFNEIKCAARRLSALLLASALAACGGGGGGGDDSPGQSPVEPPSTDGGYTISGTIQVPVATTTDSDVNDDNAPYRDNGGMSVAQPLGNPVSAGGYVNRPGEGPEGRSQVGGDEFDYFRITLAQGDQVQLFVADPDGGDADLNLLDSSGVVVDGSYSVGSYESVTAPADGDFYVMVNAYRGASNYVLVAGEENPFAQAGALRLAADFAVDEAIVIFRKSSAITARKNMSSLTVAGQSRTVRAGSADRRVLLGLRSSSGSRADRGGDSGKALQFADTEMQAKYQTLMQIKEMRSDPNVALAEPNYRYEPTGIANDPLYNYQWHYAQIALPSAWDTTQGIGEVVVAVVDTGVLLAHPDLQGQLTDGFDFIRDPANALDGDGIDPNPDDPGDNYPYGGSSFHGTHVAGTVAAATNNYAGVAGVAPMTKVMPLRVLGANGGYSYDIDQAIRFAAGLPNDSGRVPSRRADVINLSLGGPFPSASTAALVDEVRRQGVVVVASRGNSANAAPSYPASHPGVVAVSAVGFDQQLASYSSYGDDTDVAAPGGDFEDLNGDGYSDGVLSTVGIDTNGYIQMDYGFMMGTSMAAPHVAGVVALMKSVNSELTPDEFDQLLASGALTRDIGAPGRDSHYGHGLIDAPKAVMAALNGGVPDPEPGVSVDPGALRFGFRESTSELLVSGSGNAQVIDVASEVPWLSVVTTETNSRGLGRYNVRADRAQLAPGTHSGTLLIATTSNTIEVAVTVLVAQPPGDADAGLHHVVAVDPERLVAVRAAIAAAAGGSYRYQIDGLEAGSYRVFAGSDPDNDGYICEIGESCGSYGSDGSADIVEVNRDISGLDFTTRFILGGESTGSAQGLSTR